MMRQYLKIDESSLPAEVVKGSENDYEAYY